MASFAANVRATDTRRLLSIALTLVILTACALFPLMVNPLSDLLDLGIFMLAYVMFALGLNIVVGFAGLLDLGYVAFYAIGAYSIGWFASDHFSAAARRTPAIRSTRSTRSSTSAG